MLCGSVSGFTQYQTVVEAPPHLVSVLVREGPFSPGLGSGGVLPILALQGVATSWTENQLEHLPVGSRQKARRLLSRWQRDLQEARRAVEADSPLQPVPAMARRLPLAPHPLFTGFADYYNDWIVPPASHRRKRDDLGSRVDQVCVPVCHLGGWYDLLLGHTLKAFTLMQMGAATKQARKAQRLIIGPWVHGHAHTHGKPVGLLEFGPNARLDFFAFRQRWYDAQLKRQGSLKEDPTVWLYLTGPDRWLGFETWPPPQTVPTPWYLHSSTLASAPPDSAQNPDAYEYDPDDPVPSLVGGGGMSAGVDQRPIEHRLLTYTSPALQHPMTLLGPLKTVLHAASSAPDTDWVVRLTMVRPDGASVILSGGILRARYRRSLRHEALLEPDRPERFDIEMVPVSIVVPAGCSLRLTVTSSDFPAHDRNLNTGGTIGRERKGRPAINMVYHDRLRPSHVLLPTLGPDSLTV